MKNKALFLDRDGTINIDYGYVSSVDKFEFIDGVFDFCAFAQSLGYKIIVITNQSGIARGYYTVADYERVTKYMCDEFMKHDIKITDVLYCPELSGPNRKPEPGLFLLARDKYDIDMNASVSVGDKERDLQAARAAGVKKNFLFQNNYQELRRKI